MDKLLLTPEELDKLAKEYPLLDFSFEDDYREEVQIIRKAQLAKAQKARLGRPELRERDIFEACIAVRNKEVDPYTATQQILALFPDKEEIGGKADKLIGGFAEGVTEEGYKSLAPLVEELRQALRDLNKDPLYQVIKGREDDKRR